MKNRVLPENRFLPGDPERQTGAIAGYYNTARDRESLNTVTPADVCIGRDKAIPRDREKIKTDNPATPPATSKTSTIVNHTNEPEPPVLKPV
jgi:hypothetical protein